MLASVIDQGPSRAAEKLIYAWSSIGSRDVFRSPVRSVLSLLAWHLHHQEATAPSLLDTSPMAKTIGRLAGSDFRRNIKPGLLDAVAVVASSCSKRQAVAFVDKIGSSMGHCSGDALVYRCARLGLPHLLASAAFPCVFPPMWVVDDWYVDGGVHLNTPLKPAIDLGADRLLVVGGTAIDQAYVASPGEPPDVADGGAQVLLALLTDRTKNDLATLAGINAHVRAQASAGASAQHRLLSTCEVNPSSDGLSQLAAKLWKPSWRHPMSSLGGNRLLGGLLHQRQHPGQFLSYLCFDPDFISGAIDQGQADARTALGGSPSIPWRTP
jgi:NTE family protein